MTSGENDLSLSFAIETKNYYSHNLSQNLSLHAVTGFSVKHAKSVIGQP